MDDVDFIVVGGGTAGCVVADRLSENRTARVLLVEAGGSDLKFQIQLPIGYGLSFYDRRVNWMYRTEPDVALGNRQGYWPRGRVLGGSGSINAMVHIRGLPADYDDWAAAGNAGWGWPDVRGYFRRVQERVPGTDVAADAHPLCQRFLEAGAAHGFEICRDFNEGPGEGVGIYRIATRGGRRQSSARAYLRGAVGRPSLTIMSKTIATRIVFEGRRAIGVEIMDARGKRLVRARREVVLCAGSIETPKLMQVSGLGPGGLLSRIGVAVVADLPSVGRHMQDHLCIDHLYRARIPTLNQQLGTWPGRVAAALRYVLTRGGPLALSVNQAGGFVRTRPELERPDMQLYFSPLSYTRTPAGTRPLMRPDPFPGFLMSAQPCRPTSRGRIEIVSPDARSAPAIHPNSLATPEDVAAILAGSRLLRDLSVTPAMRAAIDAELKPGEEVASDADLLADIRQRAGTVFHPVSTCRMAATADEGVVDARLRVHGIEGLRIADASVFPFVTSGNTNLPTMMVAEKAADLIRGRSPPAPVLEGAADVV